MTDAMSVTADELRQFIERAEQLAAEKADVAFVGEGCPADGATVSLKKRQWGMGQGCSFVQPNAERGGNNPPKLTHHRHSLFTGRSHPTASLVQP